MPLEQPVIGVLADVDGVLTPLVAPKDERRALVDRADCGVLTSRRLSNDSSISISSRPCAVFLLTHEKPNAFETRMNRHFKS